jgi:prepilin-type N-terminal cleavage/methylation domain-containing protein
MIKDLGFKNKKKGFTLIEIMTALAIFAVVMTISMGSILGIFEANRKSRSLKAVMANINLSLESMSKEMRYGRDYHCGSSGSQTAPQNCSGGDTYMSFLSSGNEQITYRFNGGAIEKQVGNGEFIAVTAPEVLIDNLTFYILGAGTSDALQPKIIMKIKGHSGTTAKGRSDFTLQTLVSQRALDI